MQSSASRCSYKQQKGQSNVLNVKIASYHILFLKLPFSKAVCISPFQTEEQHEKHHFHWNYVYS